MPLPCTRRERRHCIWSSLVVTTIVACSLIVFISLQFSSYDYENYKRRTSSTGSFKAEKLTDEECEPTCFTKECVLHANFLNSRVDPSVDQCEDFYAFACGKYKEKFGKDDNGSTFADLSLIHLVELKDLLDNLEADPESASGKMKTVYDSCMDPRTSELSAMPSVQQFLEKVGIPNWLNLSGDFRFTEPSLPKALGILAAYMEFSFIEFFNPNMIIPEYIWSVGISELFESSRFSRMKIVRDRAMEYIERNKTFKMVEAFKVMMPYFDLEKGHCILENATGVHTDCSQEVDSGLSTEHCHWEDTIGVHVDCSQEVDSEWRILCEILESFVEVANLRGNVSKDHMCISCEKVQEVKNTLKLLQEVPHRDIAYLLGISFFLVHLDDLHLPLRLILQDAQAQLMKTKFYREPLPLPHWEHCIHWISKNMPLALGYEYTKNVITEPVFRQVHNMFKEGFEEVAKMILFQDWLTEEEKSFIIKQFGSYPVSTEIEIRYFLNETFVNEYYEQFHPTSGSFLNNVLESQRAYFTVDMPNQWKHHEVNLLRPFNVNAGMKEVIELGLGNFRFPTILPEDPYFLNTLRLAHSVGHEIGHLIGYSLGEFSASSPEEKMQNITSCFEMQFSNFTVESLGTNVDTAYTVYENYADNLAIILVDRLIEKYLPSADAYNLPSMPYTTKQLIYIMHSEVVCSKQSKEREEELHKVDPHPLDRFRITGMMQNSETFSKAYNCSEGSYMNPSTKCLYLKGD